nr:MAG TPA: hypothetical protein [Caudoviricetes sp.]
MFIFSFYHCKKSISIMIATHFIIGIMVFFDIFIFF